MKTEWFHLLTGAFVFILSVAIPFVVIEMVPESILDTSYFTVIMIFILAVAACSVIISLSMVMWNGEKLLDQFTRK